MRDSETKADAVPGFRGKRANVSHSRWGDNAGKVECFWHSEGCRERTAAVQHVDRHPERPVAA